MTSQADAVKMAEHFDRRFGGFTIYSMGWKSRMCRMATHERLSRLLIGGMILAGLGASYFWSPWAYLLLVGMSLNLIQYAFTGRCKVKDLFDQLGIRYEPPPAHLVVDDGAISDSKHSNRTGVEHDDRTCRKASRV